MNGIDVTIKVVVLQLTKTWEDKKYLEPNIVPKYEKKILKNPIVSTLDVPVME
jgi:hypothetical protein